MIISWCPHDQYHEQALTRAVTIVYYTVVILLISALSILTLDTYDFRDGVTPPLIRATPA